MDSRPLLPAAAILLCLGAIGYQAWTVSLLHAEVDALRTEIAGMHPAAGSAPAIASRMPLSSKGSAAAAPALGTPGAAPASDDEAAVAQQQLEALVHRTLEQQTKERAAEATSKWISWASDHTEGALSKLVEEGTLDEAHAEPILTILVNEMHDGAQLKTDVQEDRLDGSGAREAWEEMRAENDAAIAALVGEDKVETVRAAVEGRK